MALIKLNDRAVKDATTFGSISSLGEMVFISKATASASASIEFSLGDYKEYQFYFNNIHPSTDNESFTVNFSTDSGSNYNVTKTTTTFWSYHKEDGSDASLGYASSLDLAQSTSDAPISPFVNNDNDSSLSGYLHLFNPNSSTYVKHFIATTQNSNSYTYSTLLKTAGYANTTSALTNIRFKFPTGNIDAGEIILFGIN